MDCSYSLRTPLCLIFRPKEIAAAALYLALKCHPDDDLDVQAQMWNLVSLQQHDFEGTPLVLTIGPKSSPSISISYSTIVEIANEILDQYVNIGKGSLERKPGSDYQPNTPSHPSPLPGTPSWQSLKEEKVESPSMRIDSTVKPNLGTMGLSS